jgi:glycosyltransferase involved in cell wall biosynthesis
VEAPHALTVALVVSDLDFGGAQRQVVHLASALDRRRFEVHVCSLSPLVPLAGILPDRESRLHIVEKRSKYDLSVIPRLRTLLARLRADIAHGFLFDAQLATRVAARLARVPVVVDSERNSNYKVKRIHRLAFRLTRGCVDLVIANSRAGAEFHRAQHGHPERQYRVVYNGVDTERFRPLPREGVRRELGIDEDEVVLGMFGSYKPQKNHPLFLAAAARVLERHPRTRLLLVGDPLRGGLLGSREQKQRVEALAERLGLRARCLFLGNRPDPERLYNACDVTVLPSLHEGTPNVLLEAMACGVPAVATDVGDNAYVIPHGQAGFIVPSGDEAMLADRLSQLVADASLRHRFGTEARRQMVDRFSLPRLAADTAAVYESAWAERPRR